MSIFYDDEECALVATCDECGHREQILCGANVADRVFEGREHIQDIFPNVDPGVRELFISGECGVCFSLDCLDFPQEALDDISRYASELLDKNIQLKSKSALRHMLKDLEHSDDTGIEDYFEKVQMVRDKIEEIADKIDDGEYDDEDC